MDPSINSLLTSWMLDDLSYFMLLNEITYEEFINLSKSKIDSIVPDSHSTSRNKLNNVLVLYRKTLNPQKPVLADVSNLNQNASSNDCYYETSKVPTERDKFKDYQDFYTQTSETLLDINCLLNKPEDLSDSEKYHIIENWMTSYSYRKQTYTEKGLDLIKKLKVLETDLAYQLISYDFKKTFDETENFHKNLLTEWAQSAEFLVQYAKSLSENTVKFDIPELNGNYIKVDYSNLDDVFLKIKISTDGNRVADTLAFLILPALIKHTFRSNQSSGTWKITKEKSTDSFMQHIKDHESLDTINKDYSKFLQSHSVQEPQPYVVCCGPLDALTCVHAVVEIEIRKIGEARTFQKFSRKLLENGESDEEVFEQPDDASSSSDSEASSAVEEDSDVEMEDVNRLSEILPEIVPGPAGDVEHACTIEEFWSCLFDESMIYIVVQNTNKKIKQESLQLVVEDRIESYHHHTDEIEIKAFIGLLYYTGLWKSTSVNDNRLWNKKNGITFYRCMFSRSRFTFLTKCLPFDDSETRNKND
uniref:PiggyBac transposable element-derived protein domain-containing protein n=1 Tax=Trichogramma kaykai TaxID=54128 RepID=A0ABD2WGZ8_9HYME